MYQVNKDNVLFYVNEEDKAKRYAMDGYDVFKVNRLIINDDGELEEETQINEAGVGQSEILDEPKHSELL